MNNVNSIEYKRLGRLTIQSDRHNKTTVLFSNHNDFSYFSLQIIYVPYCQVFNSVIKFSFNFHIVDHFFKHRTYT